MNWSKSSGGGSESVYRVHHLTAHGSSWPQAARFAVGRICQRYDDARVGEVRGLRCELDGDGTIRFVADMAISLKYPTGPTDSSSNSNPRTHSTEQGANT